MPLSRGGSVESLSGRTQCLASSDSKRMSADLSELEHKMPFAPAGNVRNCTMKQINTTEPVPERTQSSKIVRCFQTLSWNSCYNMTLKMHIMILMLHQLLRWSSLLEWAFFQSTASCCPVSLPQSSPISSAFITMRWCLTSLTKRLRMPLSTETHSNQAVSHHPPPPPQDLRLKGNAAHSSSALSYLN